MPGLWTLNLLVRVHFCKGLYVLPNLSNVESIFYWNKIRPNVSECVTPKILVFPRSIFKFPVIVSLRYVWLEPGHHQSGDLFWIQLYCNPHLIIIVQLSNALKRSFAEILKVLLWYCIILVITYIIPIYVPIYFTGVYILNLRNLEWQRFYLRRSHRWFSHGFLI